MLSNTISIACIVLSGAPPLGGGTHEVASSSLRVSGDSPPVPALLLEGNIDVTFGIAGSPFSGAPQSFAITSVPPGAAVTSALFITGLWDSPGASAHTMDLTFAGRSYGSVTAWSVDLEDSGTNPYDPLDLGAYVVDVTQDVPGNGVYDFQAVSNQPPGSPPWASLLCVVYSAPSLDEAEVRLNLGGESLLLATSTTAFSGVSGGTGTLHVFTEADDESHGSEDEALSLNGVQVACCDIFGASSALYGSIVSVPVVTVAGTNTLALSTGVDWFGWHMAALVTKTSPVSTEQTSWGEIKSLYR